MDRSLNDENYRIPFSSEDESLRRTLERLAVGGYFQNNRKIFLICWWPSINQFCRVLCPMNNLEKLSLLHWALTLTEHVPQLFRSCPKLTELHLCLYERLKTEINESLKIELRSGLQRLRLFELYCDINSGPVIQEMFT